MIFNAIAEAIRRWQIEAGHDEPTVDELRRLDLWANTDVTVLQSLSSGPYRVHTGLNRSKMLAQLRRRPRHFGLNALASMSWDGRLRETACVNLAEIGDCSLPYLMRLSYDWYEPTAKTAVTYFRRSLPSACDKSLERCLLLLSAIDRSGKFASEPVVALRAESEARPGFLRDVRRRLPGETILALMKGHFVGFDEDEFSVLREALTHGDPRVVAFSLEHIATIDGEDGLIDSLAMSPSYHARLKAVEAAARLDREDLLWDALLDGHWRVRGSAQIVLNRRGHGNLVDYYRGRFPKASAVAGFGELAKESELQELAVLLGNPNPRVRFEVIRAWRNRDLRDKSPLVVGCLADSTRRVVREAIRTLEAFHVVIEASHVVKCISQSDDPKTRRLLTDALKFVPRWTGLRAWLGFQETPEAFDRPIPLPKWIGTDIRYYSSPKPHQLAELEDALRAVHDRVDPIHRARIEWELAEWKGKAC